MSVRGVQIHLGQAENLRDVESLGRMDPVVTVSAGKNATAKSQVHKDAGSNLDFNETLVLDVQGENELLLQVYDNEHIKDDELIGKAKINLDAVLAGQTFNEVVQLHTKHIHRRAGQIHVKITPIY
ncbi:hypothetical protein AMAG_17161 [Allomyces macrogynus ATCC 38327]|uniref:C2 domain-containing protein n=1 Tax=Allomyces macrogynus (strain ATCC 38327) TaxID=578462 RepID=A0A0L0TDW0_ALLM3|nr:hypothetical protein AMAG_17161 [Allomyces macrogynus ATCC 38327]|eukprot:KNE72927.1 hypothetical protein AMAG_17161 [Allomyces macrogynus ATCC 38327]